MKHNQRTFGRGKPYVSARLRRRRRENRIAAAVFVICGLVTSLGSYALLGTEGGGDAGLVLGLASFCLYGLAVIAATEA